MRILVAARGYPPELQGGGELAAQALARAAARAGHEVLVVAGCLERDEDFSIAEHADVDPPSGARVAVRRFRRADLWVDHWQKAASAPVARAFRALCREWRPDVVHVTHWQRLSSDLVLAAAREAVPCVVMLPDHHVTCLLTHRVHPVEKRPCTRAYSAGECVRCAGIVPPRTPWIPREQQFLSFGERAAAFARELRLARAVLVPSIAHGEALVRQLVGEVPGIQVAPPMRGARLARRTAPDRGARLVLGSWRHGSPGPGSEDEAAALLARAMTAPGLAERLELRVEGDVHPDDLARHPVTDVHAMLSSTLAEESYGIEADEALELGLPMVLPRAPAFLERFSEGDGVLFYEPADAADLARVLERLADEPGLLERLRHGLPDPHSVTPPDDEVAAFHLELWARVAREGAPLASDLPAEEWYADRMRAAAEQEWDAACARTSAAELGIPGGDR